VETVIAKELFVNWGEIFSGGGGDEGSSGGLSRNFLLFKRSIDLPRRTVPFRLYLLSCGSALVPGLGIFRVRKGGRTMGGRGGQD